MAVVTMQKVAVLAHKSLKEDLLEALHHEGVLEVSETDNAAPIDHTEVQYREAELQFAIQTLKEFASKATLVASQKKTSEEAIIHAANHTDVRGIIDTLHALEEKDTNLEKAIHECTSLQEKLAPWQNLPYDLQTATTTANTVLLFGTLPTANYAQLADNLQSSVPRTSLLQVNNEEGMSSVAALVWKTDRIHFEEIATTLGWTTETLPVTSGTPVTATKEAAMRQRELELERQKNHEERVRLSVELPNLIKVATFLRWLNEKQSAREAMIHTSDTITLLGWMPKKKIDLLESRLQKISPAVALLKIKADENEESPVLLHNARWVTPFRSVTGLYGLPLPSEMDPTPSLAPFFTIFFALCLTDAGYGIILALVFGTVIFRKKLTAEESPLIWTLFIGGVATVIAGILFGGWLGLSPESVPAVLTRENADGARLFLGQIWQLNQKEGIMFLLYLSVVLGLTHIFYGIFLAGLHKWLHGQRAAAFWLDFTSHILFGSMILYGLGQTIMPDLQPLATWVLLFSVALFFWGKGHGQSLAIRPFWGLLGLINFAMNLLSNGLSYLRILALGLVTGALAGAVNQVAMALGELFPLVIGIPIIIIIFVVGHLGSIALNTLGTFIHSGRLQFIEFFSQFFEGGGRSFAPYRRSP